MYISLSERDICLNKSSLIFLCILLSISSLSRLLTMCSCVHISSTHSVIMAQTALRVLSFEECVHTLQSHGNIYQPRIPYTLLCTVGSLSSSRNCIHRSHVLDCSFCSRMRCISFHREARFHMCHSQDQSSNDKKNDHTYIYITRRTK